MRNHMKRSIAALVAVLLCVGFATFTQWGFDPASWSHEGRFFFAFTTIWLALVTYACPIWED